MAQFNSIRFQPNRPLLKEITAERLNAVLAEIKKNRVRGERGITVRQTGDTTFVGLAVASQNVSTQQTSHPFQISSAQNPDNANQYLVTVRPGTLNQLLPTNCFTDNALTPFSVPLNQLRYVTLKATTDGKQILSCELSVESHGAEAQTPTPWGLPASFELVLGVVFNASIYQIVFDNLSYKSVLAYTTDVENPQFGQLPYSNFYFWGP